MPGGRRRRTLTALLLLVAGALSAPAHAQDAAAVSRGEYVFRAAGCLGCHTDVKKRGPALAGGRALATPFGTFYGPNITPDPDHGIGGWSDKDFARALREGVAPDGSHYFPAFPYTSFTRMTDGDIRDLKAYLFAQPPVPRPNTPHDLQFPFGWRFLVTFWKWLYFLPGPMEAQADKPASWNRGAYLAQALGHCGECHTPRDRLGGMKDDMLFAGTNEGTEGGTVPNITPEPETGIGKWSTDDVLFLLQIGLTPEGDVVGAQMGEVVEGTGKLTPEDRSAIAEFLRALAPIRNRIEKKKP